MVKEREEKERKKGKKKQSVVITILFRNTAGEKLQENIPFPRGSQEFEA